MSKTWTRNGSERRGYSVLRYREEASRDYLSNDGPYKTELKEEEFFNSGGVDGYIKCPVIAVKVDIHSRYTRKFIYDGSTIDDKTLTQDEHWILYYYPRRGATDEDKSLLIGNDIKDAIIRFGLNRQTGEYGKIGKVVALILSDGSRYEFHGDKLPWHRFGDYTQDYESYDEVWESKFTEMIERDGGTFEAIYSHERYGGDPYAEYYDDWKDMADEGAQFSWMD